MLAWLAALLRPSQPLRSGSSRLQERLSLAEEALDTLRRDFSRMKQDNEALQLDWATTLNRIGQWASRQAAREQRAAQRSLEQATTVETPNPALTVQPGQPLSKSQLRQLVAQRRQRGA